MKVDRSLIHRLFYPQVPLVLAARHGGRVSAMPVVSYLSVSDDPPLVAVGCSPRGFTCRLVLKARCFSLSVLDAKSADALSNLATVSGEKVKDKLSEAGLHHAMGTRAKVPVLKDAIATLECTLKSSRKEGDHLLLVGKVLEAHASSAFTDSWDYSMYKPILYTGWKDGLTIFPVP